MMIVDKQIPNKRGSNKAREGQNIRDRVDILTDNGGRESRFGFEVFL